MKTGKLILAGVLMAGGLAWAQGPGGPGMGHGFAQHRPPMEQAFGLAGGQFWNNPNLVKQLNLTDDQRKAMDGILQDHRMKLIDLQATLQKAEVTMGPLMKADTPNRSAIEAQIDKVVQARADLEKANARFLLDIRMQLTPDQWKQLRTMRENHMERGHMGDGRDGHDGRGWGPGGPGMNGPGSQFHHRQGPPPAGAA
ncbi:MAG: Spy/CpxP family protein refolding chaperone, partial [Terracidiphilus sp.]